MYRSLALIVSLLVFSTNLHAQDKSSAQNRLTLFQNVELTCKARLLGNAELANSLVSATDASLSEICECAAMLTVANVTNERLSAVFSGDKAVIAQIDGESRRHFLNCLERR